MSQTKQAPQRLQDLDEALALTDALRARVETGDFAGAAALEAARRARLERFFAAHVPASDLTCCVARLRELVTANDALVGLAEHRQRALAREAETVATGRQAVRAYAGGLR